MSLIPFERDGFVCYAANILSIDVDIIDRWTL